jgi:hypothetical protein
MIAKACSISHGSSNIRYITGESVNKKHPEKIFHIEDRFLPEGLDAHGIMEMISSNTDIAKNVIQFEISPPKEYTAHFSHDDWMKLWHDFMHEFDNFQMSSRGKTYSDKTNIENSISTCWVHFESKGEIPHLHAAVSRVDINGKTNNDHNIHIRAQRAAEAVAKKRGWKSAMQRHKEIVTQINKDCADVLRTMSKWDWRNYVKGLEAKGYNIHMRPDKNGNIHGYSLQIGESESRYKSSILGVGRNLMYKNLEATWRTYHPTVEQTQVKRTPQPTVAPSPKPKAPVVMTDEMRFAKHSQWMPNAQKYTFAKDGTDYRFYVPNRVDRMFQDAFDWREVSNCDDLCKYAAALFVGLLSLDEAPVSSGGGGSSNNEGWRDKKDEDDVARANRCIHFATNKVGITKRTGRRLH